MTDTGIDIVQQESFKRHIDLDWLRIAAFGLLIFYHMGMLFVTWDFHVKSQHIIPGLEPLMLVLSPWRLALLFLISGVATRFMVAKMRVGILARRRSVRLLLPLIFGMLVVIPPQSYFEVIEKFGFTGDFADFYLHHYLIPNRDFCREVDERGTCLILPTWNHLWFVAYLWVYTILLIALYALMPQLVRSTETRLSRTNSIFVLILPAAIFCALRIFLFPTFGETHALIDDWYNHAVYLSFFTFGFLIARSSTIWIAAIRWRWLALAIAVASYAFIIVTRNPSIVSTELSKLLINAHRCAYGLQQWFAVIAVVGFGHRWLATRDSSARLYLTDAVFSFYIVHQTVLIALAHTLKPYGLSALVEATIILSATAAACLLTYEIANRFAWLRLLFGIKASPSELPNT